MLSATVSRWCSLAVVGALTLVTISGIAAQDATAAKGKAKAKVDAPAKTAVAKEDTKLNIEPLIWPEKDREKLLRNEFPELPATPITAQQIQSVLEMARGGASADAALIKRYVDFYAAELTRRVNIAGMTGEGLDPDKPRTPEEMRRARALDDAASRLIEPLAVPPTAGTQSFRRMYSEQLKRVAEPLLSGHLLTRSFFMVVLSRAAAPELASVIVDALADADQTYTVKMLGAVGLIATSRGGRRPLDSNREAIPAAESLLAFLEQNPDAPWPVQMRCLEALGVLRQSTPDPASRKAEFADIPFQILANPDADALVRTWAAWALSRMEFQGLGGAPNLELVAYQLGRAAAAAGDKLITVPVPTEAPTRNLKMAARYAEPLIRALEAFEGDPELRGSGFNRMAAGASGTRGIEQRIRALATAAVQFTLSAGNQVVDARAAVRAANDELKAFLASNPPKNLSLYAGGPTVQLAAAASKPAAEPREPAADAKPQP